MRYGIKCINGNNEYFLLQNEDETLLLSGAKLCETINKPACLTFSIPQCHANYDKIHRLESEIVVLDLDGSTELFRGRVVSDESDIYGNKMCTCLDALAYLMDTQCPPDTYTGSIQMFLMKLLGNHNGKVQPQQRLYLGNVTVNAPEGNVHWQSEDYCTVLSLIQEKIVDIFSGFLQVRRNNNNTYLDYLGEFPLSDQVARLGENILSMRHCIHTENVRTAILPLGAVINTDTGERLKVGSVNNGSDYIIDTALVEQYGWIEAAVEFDEETLAKDLLAKCRKYMEQCRNMVVTMELNMADGRYLGLDVQRIRPGMLVKVEAALHGIDTYFLCSGKVTDLLNPENDRITLTNKFSTYAEAVDRAQKEYGRKFKAQIKGIENALSGKIDQTKADVLAVLKDVPGLYKTKENPANSPEVYYFHNKEKKADSDILMTFNSSGFQVSADSGKSWYGLKVDEDMVTDLLKAAGINADWINSGTLRASLVGGLDITDKSAGMAVSAGVNGFCIQDTKNNKYLLNMKNDTAQRKLSLAINGKEGKTGRAEFSDGSYMDFQNGIFIGGYTKENGQF